MKRIIIVMAALVFILLVVSLTGIYIASFAVDENIITSSNNMARAASAPIVSAGEINPNTYKYNVNVGQIKMIYWNAWQIPEDGDGRYGENEFEIYCIEPGGWIKNLFKVDLDEARSLVGLHSSYGSISATNNGLWTQCLYTPTGNPISLSPAAAFIISDSPKGSWTEDRQKGLWNLRFERIDASDTDYLDDGIMIGNSIDADHEGSSSYDTIAKDFATYERNIGNNGLNPTDNTNHNSVKLELNNNTQKYTAGPFTISYANGTYGSNTFAGISNMTVLGYNRNGTLINSNIKVEKIIMNGREYTPDYFTPDSTTKYDTTSQTYPKSGQTFYVIFSDPNAGKSNSNYIANVNLQIKFKYMIASGQYKKLQGKKYQVKWKRQYRSGGRYYRECYLREIEQQWCATMDAIRTIYEQQLTMQMGEIEEPIMNLGGHVWEDAKTGKETAVDGVSTTRGDISLKNVKVTLYTSDGKVATLLSNPREAGISEQELMCRINPTYTDASGNYMFKGLDPTKRYYVVFEYNGQRYMPTEYLNTANGQYNSVTQMVNAGLYNTTAWNTTSKATEANTSRVTGVEITRTDFDNRFSEIRSYPNNYRTSNSLGRIGTYNSVYTQLELMGYTMDSNGRYTKTGTQLVDGYLYNEQGLETTTYSEGVISSRVRDYIRQNKKFPDDNAMKSIYSAIAGNNSETWRKLQFIEDTNIQAYTGSPFTQNIDYYPASTNFDINDNGVNYSSGGAAQSGNYDTSTSGGAIAIYPGQYYVNLGLWRRQEFDTSARKDVYKAALKINDKTVVYTYDKRAAEQAGANNANGQDNNTYWDINVRMSDYNSYYGVSYNREIYESDYNYSANGSSHPGNDLEVYITYKVTIRNQSMSVMSQIKEVVDYYDSDYTFKPNLSWAMYQTSSNRTTSVNSDAYYAMLEQSQEVIDSESTSPSQFITNAQALNAYEGSSRYGNNKNLGNQYKNLYIRGLENKKLATGESAYLYLTFEVNKDSSGKVVLDNDSSPKENLVEINGYSTYYRDGTELPNNVRKGSGNLAGLLDRDSNPGNLVASDLQGDRYEQNFEDDTDRAPSLRLLLDEGAIRQAAGRVWEDQRTQTVGNASTSQDAIIGDGIRQENETGISGVTVQLVEKCTDGSEYIWMETTTDENGRYNFSGFIPGDYVIRFYYGDTAQTVVPSAEQPVSYNGQDFKSTTYQAGITQSGSTDESGNYSAYTNTATQNESATYGYDIAKADSAGVNYSDAKDIWSTSNREGLNIIGPVNSAREVQGREEVNSYSTGEMTNHKAEVLASAYERPTYNGTEYTDEQMADLRQELMNETYMTAETGVIVAEFEYDRQQTDGQNTSSTSNSNEYNGNYTLNDIDLGLTERPKAQIEVDKSIENVRVVLVNSSLLFDINEAANNAIWQDHQEYSIDRYKVDANDSTVGDNDYYQEGDAIGMYEEYYRDENRHRYSYRNEIDNIVTRTDKGLIQLTMDEEVMHGATIQITYTVKVTNVGEVDYIDGNSKNFYYTGRTTGAHVVATTVNQVVDYVQNNLQFDSNNETNSASGWAVITGEELINQGLVNAKLKDNLKQFNNIIQTGSFGEGEEASLEPGDEISKTLILSQLITAENEEDDLTYTNMVEVVKTTNEYGRRMAYSVVGNQDPLLDDASEVDSSSAERIIILPPFGIVNIQYIIGAIVGVILIAGIILIRRKVLKKKKQ